MRKITIEVPDSVADDLVKKYDKKTPWKPEDGEEYWVISTWTGVRRTFWTGPSADEHAYSIGNGYRTEEEAKQALEKMKALATIRRHAEQFEFVADWDDRGQLKYTVGYDHFGGSLSAYSRAMTQHYSAAYYPTKEAAQQAISEVGDAYLTLFGVKS